MKPTAGYADLSRTGHSFNICHCRGTEAGAYFESFPETKGRVSDASKVTASFSRCIFIVVVATAAIVLRLIRQLLQQTKAFIKIVTGSILPSSSRPK
jgi:hypothetical protein